MITRIHGATSTLAANPRKRKHNPRRRKAKKHTLGLSLMKNPRHRRKARKAHNPRRRRKSRNPGVMSMLGKFRRKLSGRKHRKVHTKRRNPGGLVIAGVPVIEMAIGSVAAIAVGHTVDALIAKYAPASLPSFLVSKENGVLGEVLTAAGAALLYTKGPQKPMVKEVAKYAFIGAVFQAISKLAKKPISDALDSVLPGGTTKGYYFDPYSAPSTSGLYLNADTGAGAVGGMYATVDHGAMSGLDLFKAPSIYG